MGTSQQEGMVHRPFPTTLSQFQVLRTIYQFRNVSDTVDLFAYEKSIPTITHDEYVQQALMDILAVLQKKSKMNVPSLQYGERINDAVIAVSTLLGKAIPKPILQSHIKPTTSVNPPEERVSTTSKLYQLSKSENTSQVPRVQHFAHSTLSIVKPQTDSSVLVQQIFQLKINHIYNENGKKETLDTLLLKNSEIWNKALSNEWGRLA